MFYQIRIFGYLGKVPRKIIWSEEKNENKKTKNDKLVCKGRKVKSLDIPCKGKGFDAGSEYRIVTLIFSTRQPFSKVSFSNMNFVTLRRQVQRSSQFLLYSGFPYPFFSRMMFDLPSGTHAFSYSFCSLRPSKNRRNCWSIGNWTRELC